MSRPPRRVAAVLVVLCCAAALSLGPGTSSGAGARTAAAAATEYEIAQETLDDLADVRPGDVVHVTIQSKIDSAATFATLTGGVQYCPVPFPGNPADPQQINDFCRPASGFIPADLVPDQNGRIEFTVTIPPEAGNIFPPNPSDPEGFSCEPGRRCAIAFQFLYLEDPVNFVIKTVPDVTSLAFTAKEPLAVAGCAAPEAGKFVDAAGPSRLAHSEVGWAQQRCQGGRPLDLDYVVVDEVTAREQFREGQGDVFFGGGGVTADEDQATADKRKSVPVPVALNAQVLAVVGGFHGMSATGGQRPTQLTDIKLTTEQIADLLINPDTALSTGPNAAAALAANPQLAQVPPNGRSASVSIVSYATPQVGHWLTSRYLADRTPSWKYPQNFGSISYERPGEPIGELWELSSLNPASRTTHVQKADRSVLGRQVDDEFLDCSALGACVNFLLTDLATAQEMNLPVAQVQNAAGQFVAPTAKTMSAAADDMTALPDGSLVPDLTRQDPNAYPFTFVEYANVAAEVGDACKARTVRDVLNFLVDAERGQNQLAAGLAPLPAALSAQAEAAVQRVGPQTPCEPGSSDGEGAGEGGPAGPGALAGSTLPTGGVGGAGTSSAGAAGDHPTRPVTAAGQQQALRAANNATIPLFAGMAALVLLVPLSALALTNGLTSGAAFGSAGRRLPPRVARALAVIGAPLRRALRRVARR